MPIPYEFRHFDSIGHAAEKLYAAYVNNDGTHVHWDGELDAALNAARNEKLAINGPRFKRLVGEAIAAKDASLFRIDLADTRAAVFDALPKSPPVPLNAAAAKQAAEQEAHRAAPRVLSAHPSEVAAPVKTGGFGRTIQGLREQASGAWNKLFGAKPARKVAEAVQAPAEVASAAVVEAPVVLTAKEQALLFKESLSPEQLQRLKGQPELLDPLRASASAQGRNPDLAARRAVVEAKTAARAAQSGQSGFARMDAVASSPAAPAAVVAETAAHVPVAAATKAAKPTLLSGLGKRITAIGARFEGLGEVPSDYQLKPVQAASLHLPDHVTPAMPTRISVTAQPVKPAIVEAAPAVVPVRTAPLALAEPARAAELPLNPLSVAAEAPAPSRRAGLMASSSPNTLETAVHGTGPAQRVVDLKTGIFDAASKPSSRASLMASSSPNALETALYGAKAAEPLTIAVPKAAEKAARAPKAPKPAIPDVAAPVKTAATAATAARAPKPRWFNGFGGARASASHAAPEILTLQEMSKGKAGVIAASVAAVGAGAYLLSRPNQQRTAQSLDMGAEQQR